MESEGRGSDKGTATMENLPYLMMLPDNNSQVMTDEQMETLRRQISVYSTICSQLVEMHKVMSQHIAASQHMLYDPIASGPGFRTSARQRWTPSQTQLHILERLYECGNGTPSKQKIKEITCELSQHGPISETNVYNWFQNRKARAKRKQLLVPQKEGESEFDTDGESYREKKPKTEDEFNKEDTSAWYDEKTVGAFERNHGIIFMGSEQAEAKPQIHERNHEMITMGPRQIDTNAQTCDKKYGVGRVHPHSTDQKKFNDSQDNVSSSLLLFQTEAEAEADALLERSGNATIACTANEISVSNQQEPGAMTVLLDGKRWEVPIGVVDVRKQFGDNAILLDSHGHVVPTNDAGVTFHPLHASESYSLLRHGEVNQVISEKSSSNLLAESLYHISGY